MNRIGRRMVVVSMLMVFAFIGGAVGDSTSGAVQAVGSGAISGAVSDGTTGVAGVAVRAYDAPTGAFVAKTTTDAAGHYTIGALPVGGYKVLVNGTDANWQIQFYGGATSLADATVVPVVVGADAIADVVLVAGGGISVELRTINDFPTACVRDVPIRVYDLSGTTLVAKMTTPAVVFGNPLPGFVGGLPAGSYLVRVGDGVRCHLAWWSGAPYGVRSRLDAVPVTVVAGQTTPIRVSPLPTVTLHGTVTDSATGGGVEGIDVRLYNNFDDGYAPLGSLAAKTRTGPDGQWGLSSLKAGGFAVRFSDPNGHYVLVWYQDQQSFADATSPIVFPGNSLTVDQSMTPTP
jgi:hypothetical protein